MAIQFRRGLAQDFDATKLESGEPAFCTDTGEFYIGKPGTPNTGVRMLSTDDDVFRYRRTLSTGDDLDNIYGADATGFYEITSGVANSPSDWGTVEVICGNGEDTGTRWTKQIAYFTTLTCFRTRNSNGTWTAWVIFRTTNEQPLYSSATLSNESLVNCTGTVAARPAIWRNQYYEYYLSGKLEITNLVRTGSAPGYRCSTNFTAGYNIVGQSGIMYINGTPKPEVVTARITTSGAFSIDMTESLGAIPNGKMIILFPVMPMIRI